MTEEKLANLLMKNVKLTSPNEMNIDDIKLCKAGTGKLYASHYPRARTSTKDFLTIAELANLTDAENEAIHAAAGKPLAYYKSVYDKAKKIVAIYNSSVANNDSNDNTTTTTTIAPTPSDKGKRDEPTVEDGSKKRPAENELHTNQDRPLATTTTRIPAVADNTDLAAPAVPANTVAAATTTTTTAVIPKTTSTKILPTGTMQIKWVEEERSKLKNKEITANAIRIDERNLTVAKLYFRNLERMGKATTRVEHELARCIVGYFQGGNNIADKLKMIRISAVKNPSVATDINDEAGVVSFWGQFPVVQSIMDGNNVKPGLVATSQGTVYLAFLAYPAENDVPHTYANVHTSTSPNSVKVMRPWRLRYYVGLASRGVYDRWYDKSSSHIKRASQITVESRTSDIFKQFEGNNKRKTVQLIDVLMAYHGVEHFIVFVIDQIDYCHSGKAFPKKEDAANYAIAKQQLAALETKWITTFNSYTHVDGTNMKM